MSVEKYKLLKQTEKENERLILREQQAQQEEMQRQFIDRINKEVSIAKSIYPDFDINIESQDEKFRGLVERGVDVRTAYEIMHRDEFIRQAQVKAAKEVSDKIQMDAINNTSRPRENGIGGGGAVSATANIEKMSREEMAKAKEAARRGEKITFRS